MLAPGSRTEEAIFEVWKEYLPHEAFLAGLDGYAGRIFVPTAANVRRLAAKIASLLRATKDPTERKFLRALGFRLRNPEPAAAPQALVEVLFGYMVKEGIVEDHVRGLLLEGRKALEASVREAAKREWPVGQRALVQLACSGLSEILDTVGKELHDPGAMEALQEMREETARYREAFNLEGFRPEGTFDEAFEIYRREGCDMGRARIYARALRDLWDYRESPAEVEAAGLRMLRRELPLFRETVASLAKDLGCQPTAEAVEEAIKRERGLRREQILPFLLELREHAVRIADRYVVGINPHYATQVLETPPYLVNTTPSGMAMSIDYLTDRSREIFLATTDERSAGRPPPAELLNLLIHEEYGHCVHGSNSSHAYAGTPKFLDVLNSTFVCVSEGIAFQREREFLPVLQEIAAGKLRGPEEDAFAACLDRWGGKETIVRDYAFYTYLWRIVRFLRVIGDARINSGKQDLVDFLEWAHGKTGLPRATVYYQVFPAHQIIGPGYATTYAIIGERIRGIQERALRQGIPLREFNAFACSIGWPPKSLYERRLEAWLREARRARRPLK